MGSTPAIFITNRSGKMSILSIQIQIGGVRAVSKAYIKYFNPQTGAYESPLVEGMGDPSELKTTIKTSLVAAINSMMENGVPSAEINNQISYLQDVLQRVRDGELTQAQIESLRGEVGGILEIPLTEFQQGIEAQKAQWDAEVAQKLIETESAYNNRISESERILGDASFQMDQSRLALDQAREDLNSMELNVAGYEDRFDEIDNTLTTVVYENKFDLMTAEFIQNKTVEIETAEGVERKSVAQILSAMDGRVSQSEADYLQTAEELSNRITYEELKGELDQYQLDKYGENLLTGTRDFKGWNLNGVLVSTGTSYRQARSVTFLSTSQQIEHVIGGLQVGETYVVSLSVNYQGVGSPVVTLRTGVSDYPISEIYEDTRDIDGWARYYTHIVAEQEEQSVVFYVNGIPLGDEVTISGLKLEYGVKPTLWRPHLEDTWSELELYDSKFTQQANLISSWLRRIANDEDGLLSEEALWQVTAEGLLGQAKTVKEVEDGKIQRDTADLVLTSEEFSTKVSKTVNDGISDISFDNKNRIINSGFVFDFEQWENVNPNFKLREIEGVEFAEISRAGLTANNPAILKTNKFKVNNQENLMIGVSAFTNGSETIDSRNIVRLELFDLQDIRVAYQDFTIEEMNGQLLNGEVSRLWARYKVDNSLVAKGQITLQLPKNGHIGFSQLSLQNSDVNITEWQPAPEDIIMVQLRMDTWIEQDAESVAIGAIASEIEKGKLDDTSAFHEMWSQIKVTSEAIEMSVSKDGVVQSINASNEGLKIDFEKVNVTGELLADLISTQRINITDKFAFTHNNRVIFGVDPSTGDMVLNIGKLTINSLRDIETSDGSTPASKQELEEIELTPGPQGEKGEDVFKVEVHSTNGTAFKNGVIDTWIYAVVYEGHKDVTAEINASRFQWERVSDSPSEDKIWNDSVAGGVKEFRITKDDIYQKATFSCEIKE